MNPPLRYLAFIGRVLIAFIFVLSGLSKIGNPAGTMAYIANAGLPIPELTFWVTVMIEVVGGVLLTVGYQTRAAAALLALFTVLAAIFFHTNFADQMQMINFMKNLCMAGGLLQVVGFGAGAFSVDAKLGRA